MTAAEKIARAFHESYERLAPSFAYKTRDASAAPWEQVPEANRRLMIAVVVELLTFGRIVAGPDGYVVCVRCEHAAKEEAAKDEGWRFVTMHDSEPCWICGDCRTEEGAEMASEMAAM